MKVLIKPRKNYKPLYRYQTGNRTTKGIYIYELEELTEHNDNEIIFNVSLKINLKSKKGKKLLNKMLETQMSPVKLVLQEENSADRKYISEGAPEKYVLPESILELIKEDFEIKTFKSIYDY